MGLFDIDQMSSILTHLSKLTGFYLSVWGEKGNLILPPVNENMAFSAIRASPAGRDEYIEFARNAIQNLSQNDVSLMKGPAEQYHFIAPVRNKSSRIMVIGGGLFLSQEDFNTFTRKHCTAYGIPSDQAKLLSNQKLISDKSDFLKAARAVQSFFHFILTSTYRENKHEKRYRLMKAIFSLLSDLSLDHQREDVYDIFSDIMLFLFNVDSMAILIRDENNFRPIKTAGRLQFYLKDISPNTTGIVSEMMKTKKPVHTESLIEILQMGFSDSVESLFLCPASSENAVSGILVVLNTTVHQDDVDIIHDLFNITTSIAKLSILKNTYMQHIKEFDILSLAAEKLNPVREPDTLYEAIIDTSVNLTNAEKGSLMLLDDRSPYLTVKAAKGIHKRFHREIKIKSGEGVAGWVFREGAPLLVDDIEKNEMISLSRRSKYRTGAFISLPLKIGDRTIGVLNISDKISGDVFSQEDLLVLRSFASYATIALDRSNYYSLAGQLRELSITDSLTGLFNRRYFEERFYEEIHRSSRHDLIFSLAMVDIDDFKIFNDTEGHLAGDEILKCIANIAKDCLRITDVISRFGGEEFAIIMPQTDKIEAFQVAERIRKSIKEQLPCTWHSFPKDNLTITIGVATFPADGRDRKALIRNTDRALYKGKMEGKDQTVLWKR
jgi:diguanylate cyclase (GGDEF)-like protein